MAEGKIRAIVKRPDEEIGHVTNISPTMLFCPNRIQTTAPSAEAVQVVRCKDCKHYLNKHICMYFSRHGTIETSGYAYCSYAERRERVIEALPSEDRPTGEWQDEHGKPMRWTSFAGYCSNCGKWSEYLTDYCGNCGARMIGGEDE